MRSEFQPSKPAQVITRSSAPLPCHTNDPITREMARLYHVEGLTMLQIAAKFGVIKQAVHARFVRAKIPKRPPVYTKIDKQLLEKSYGENISLKKIAAQLSLSENAVQNALKHYNIPKRKFIKTGGRYTAFMRSLALGGSAEIAISTKAPHAQLHRAAAIAEIKISVRSAGGGKFNVRRIK